MKEVRRLHIWSVWQLKETIKVSENYNIKVKNACNVEFEWDDCDLCVMSNVE